MNPYTFIFCMVPMGLCLMVTAMYIAGRIEAAARNQARQDEKTEALRLANVQKLKRIDLDDAALIERQNKITIQELTIEEKRNKMGLNAARFSPDNYPDS